MSNPIGEIITHAGNYGVTTIINGDPDHDGLRMGSKYNYDDGDRVLTVFLENLTSEERAQFAQFIRTHFEATKDLLIIREDQGDVINEYKEYLDVNTDSRILLFFKDILDEDDYSALKMSLFMRNEYKSKGKPVDSFKQDIRYRFGKRGTNIANLCFAGYFEDEFMPLFNEDPEEFHRAYFLAVSKKARALFVNASMTLDDLRDEFNRMISKAKQYHLSVFRIHGIGKKNVQLIEAFIQDIERDNPMDFVVKKRPEASETGKSVEYDVILV